jgi:alpha-L-arabinofuranosidase
MAFRSSAQSANLSVHQIGSAGFEALESRTLLSSAVTVNVDQVVRTVDNQLLGVNLAWWDSHLTTSQTKTLVQAAGLNGFRFPGGSASDDYHFDDPPSFTGKGTIATFAKFIESVNGSAIVTLDYGGGSPQESAAELAYLNASPTDTTFIGNGPRWDDGTNAYVTKNWRTAGYWASIRAATPLATDDGLNFLRINHAAPFAFHDFEVGNEEYGSWEADHHQAQHDPATYAMFAEQFSEYAQQIDPSIAIGIDSGSPGGENHFTQRVLDEGLIVGFTPNFISDHSYMQGPGQETDNNLLFHSVTDSQAGGALTPLGYKARAHAYDVMLLNTYGATVAAQIKLLATEFNSVYSDPGKQITSLVNGLFVADTLGTLLQTSYDGAWIWDLRNGWDTTKNNSPSLYGWRQGGDYGLLGVSDNPSDAPSTGANIAYPNYYAEQLAAKFIQGGDNVITVNSSDVNLDVFGIKSLDGHLKLLVINKSAANNLTGQFDVTGFTPSGAVSGWQYGKSEDTAQSLTTDGHSSLTALSGSLGVSGNNFSYSFPSYSMTVLDVTNATAPPPTPNPGPTPGQELPNGWSDLDIGSPGRGGGTTYQNGVWNVFGAGSDIGGTSDSFHLVSKAASGDFSITARINSLENEDASTKGGVTIRWGTGAKAAFALVGQTPDGNLFLETRSAAGASVQTSGGISDGLSVHFLKLSRFGQSILAYYSGDGVTWTQIGSKTFIGGGSVRAGLAVSSHVNGTLASAVFDKVKITAAPALSWVKVNDGSPQRSMITSLTAVFSRVTLYSGALSLRRTSDGSDIDIDVTNPSGDGKTYVIHFEDGLDGTSLANGSYAFSINGARVRDTVGQSLSGGNRTISFKRKLGDSDGDNDVDGADSQKFAAAFGTTMNSPAYRWYFDFDADGDIDQADLTRFNVAHG